MSRRRYTIGSLFAGIGGLELGLEMAGLGPVVWQVEANPFCREVLARHWPDAKRHDDIRTASAALLGPADIVCGGFPCQDVSGAGRGAGLLDGERSSLWFDMLRLVSEMRPRPRAVVVENVAPLLSRGLAVVLSGLAELGYDLEWAILRASDVGAPHERARLFVLAHANGQRPAQPAGRVPHQRRRARVGRALADTHGLELWPESEPRGRPEAEPSDARQVADADPERRALGRDAAARQPLATNSRPHPSRGGRAAQPRVGRDADGLPAGLARWPAGRGAPPHAWEPPRALAGVARREAKLAALGNAVVPQVAAVVGRRALELLRGPK